MDDTEKFDDKKFTEALQGEDAASAGSFQAVLQGGNGSSGSGKGAAEGSGPSGGDGEANMRISAISATGRKARLAR